jgi:hypothetical protein
MLFEVVYVKFVVPKQAFIFLFAAPHERHSQNNKIPTDRSVMPLLNADLAWDKILLFNNAA